MVEEGWLSADQVVDYLGITLNNLRQIQFRKQLVWTKKQGRSVFYRVEDVQSYVQRKRVKLEIRQAKSRTSA
jgi:hypothetical protein